MTPALAPLPDAPPAGRSRRRWFGRIEIWAVLLFVLRGNFYCAFTPLWEGYDEWSHYAYVEEIVKEGTPLVSRNHFVSASVFESIKLAPAAWGSPPPWTKEEEFWRLPSTEREARAAALRGLRGTETGNTGASVYEALQPPLYYWLCAPVYRVALHGTLLDRVLLLRLWSLLIAAMAIPFIAALLRRLFGDVATSAIVLLLVVALPELMIDVCRVGNECLSIVIYSWLILLLVRDWQEPNQTLSQKALLGVALGLGLLTKAYFTTAIPALVLLAILRRGQIIHTLRNLTIAAAIAGWWYVRNRVTTGSWAGLVETVQLSHSAGKPNYWHAVLAVDWRGAFDSILLSHIWWSGWSGLHVKSWIYHVLYLIIGFAVLGVAREVYKNRTTALVPLCAIYGLFWLGELYNVLLLFLTKGASTSMGWYMYAVLAAEIVLLAEGIRNSRALVGLAFVFAGLDLYTVCFVTIPYYVGITWHGPKGSVISFHLTQLETFGVSEVLSRLSLMKPAWVGPNLLAVLFLTYLLATLAVMFLAVRWAAERKATALPESR